MKLLKRLVIPLVAMLFISMFMAFPIFPVAAAELPTLEARPSVITVPDEEEDVAIEIWATNVDEYWEIIGFEFSVPFNTEWLIPAPYEKGTFMELFVNGGEQGVLYTVVSDIPYEDSWYLTKAMVMILPDTTGKHRAPFPSGEGRLLTLYYTSLGPGAGQQMNIEIIDILILDRYLDEVPLGPGDCDVELSGWKFKVNGKAGVGLGHKSTVGQVNTFEVKVNNTGTIDACVQATFQILDSAHTPYATVTSTIESVSPGNYVILSATWTANEGEEGRYYIQGCVEYGPIYPRFVNDYTKTQTLRINVKPV